MRSKYASLKEHAHVLRKSGMSLREIEHKLKIPRSTLSGWCKNIQLTNNQKESLASKKIQGLVKARRSATLWHTQQKTARLMIAQASGDKSLAKVPKSLELLELTLAMLYLGEGIKKSPSTRMGNSDPLLIKFFLHVLFSVYDVPVQKISVYLHLRADQDPDSMKKYWSNEIGIPLDRFRKVSIDTRTQGSATYPEYKGVCVIDCGNVAIQRKLVYIGRKFCEKTIADMRG